MSYLVIHHNRVYPVGHIITKYSVFTDDQGRTWIKDNTDDKYIQKENVKMIKTTGGSTPHQYRKSVELPLTADRSQSAVVDIESMDVISAWELNFNLGNVQKAIHRFGKKEGTDERYDYNKCFFFLLRDMLDKGYITLEKFWATLDVLGIGG